MRIQRNIIYIVFSVGLISLGMSISYCFLSAPNNIESLFFNICVGVLSSSFLAILMAIISYFGEKKKTLREFYEIFLKLQRHCSQYDIKLTNVEKIDWFEKYIVLMKELDYQYTQISFLFDPFNHRGFLNDVVDFYSDFIILIENDLTEFRNTFRNSGKKVLGIKNIEKTMLIINTYKLSENEKCKCKSIINKLSNLSFKMHEGIEEICFSKCWLKKYYVDITTVENQNFQEVSSEKEKYIKEIIKQSKKNIPQISVQEITEDVVNEFVKKGLLYNDNLDDLQPTNKMLHYFKLKKKLQLSKNMSMEYLREIDNIKVKKDMGKNSKLECILDYILKIAGIITLIVTIIVLYQNTISRNSTFKPLIHVETLGNESISFEWNTKEPIKLDKVPQLNLRLTNIGNGNAKMVNVRFKSKNINAWIKELRKMNPNSHYPEVKDDIQISIPYILQGVDNCQEIKMPIQYLECLNEMLKVSDDSNISKFSVPALSFELNYEDIQGKTVTYKYQYCTLFEQDKPSVAKGNGDKIISFTSTVELIK